ncbi:MAG: helix-turn-helix domain-containing protein [Muribaculaceae bacterium]|nr:helix-turn-helix domain-containing protein [Muribaculaceae bacterium]
MPQYPEHFINKLKAVSKKRPATIINHILAHGCITSKEIKDIYGYDHPPRAIRDVREQGIPIITYRVKDNQGKVIAAYRFGDPSEIENTISKSHGRTLLSKAIKNALIEKFGAKCFIYQEDVDESLLQIDHRIPYEIVGEASENVDTYMLVSPSANRAKSWACEHCENWSKKDPDFCSGCFWAYPENYSHVAGKQERRIMLVFSGDEIEDYKKLIAQSWKAGAENFIKSLIHNAIN